MMFGTHVSRFVAFSNDSRGPAAVNDKPTAASGTLFCPIFSAFVVEPGSTVDDTRQCDASAVRVAPVAVPGVTARRIVECRRGASAAKMPHRGSAFPPSYC